MPGVMAMRRARGSVLYSSTVVCGRDPNMHSSSSSSSSIRVDRMMLEDWALTTVVVQVVVQSITGGDRFMSVAPSGLHDAARGICLHSEQWAVVLSRWSF